MERLFKHLHITLGSFPISPLQTYVSSASLTTDWLTKNEVSASLETSDECKMQSISEDKATIRFKSLQTWSEDITHHLEQGMAVKLLALPCTDKLSFVLYKDLTLCKIKCDDAFKEAAFFDVFYHGWMPYVLLFLVWHNSGVKIRLNIKNTLTFSTDIVDNIGENMGEARVQGD